MRIILLMVMLFLVGCNVVVMRESTAFSKRFKVYHYAQEKNGKDVCNDLLGTALKILIPDKNALDRLGLNCMYYVDIKSSKKEKDKVRYTAFIDFEGLFNKLKEGGEINSGVVSVSLVGDDEIKRKVFDFYKGKDFIFVDESKREIADAVCEITKNEMIIDTSAGQLHSISLNLELLKGAKPIKSFVSTGYGTREDAIKSAVVELISKLSSFKNLISVEYVSVEFLNVKTSKDLRDISDFLEKNFILYEPVGISKSSVVLNLPYKGRVEELSSKILANLKNSAVESIDSEGKKVSIVLNSTLMEVSL